MAEQPQSGWLKRFSWHNAKVLWTAAIAGTVATIASILATAAAYRGAKEAGVELPPQPPAPLVVMMGDAPPVGEYVPTTGWVPDAGAIADNLNPVWTTQFDDTPAGRVFLGPDEDVYLWRSLRKVAARPPPWYPNLDQRDVGCCVGTANKHVLDVLLAGQIFNGTRGEWKPVAAEPSYALSRNEIGGGRISGDGSVGAWIVKADKEYGVVAAEVNGRHDLTTFSPARAREWGRAGCPDDLEPIARKHLVNGTALVKSAADAERAIRQFYPIIVCSSQGYRMERDATGRCLPQGQWMHAMAIIGVRTLNGRLQFFILNSWGDRAHTGPVVPDDAPVAGFWADASVVDGMLRQGDSFALSDAAGWPSRRIPIDWFIAAPSKRDPFTLREWSIAA